MIQPINNTQPTFGMAFIEPVTQTGKSALAKRIGLGESPFVKRGLKQFIKEQKNLSYNVFFEEATNDFVVKNLKGEEVDRFGRAIASQGKKRTMPIEQFWKTLKYGFTNPKRFLPNSLQKAGHCAKELHHKDLTATKKAINEEVLARNIEDIFGS